jgi:hypothetical protein
MPYARIREATESSSAAVLHAAAAALGDGWRLPQRSRPLQTRLARLAAQLPDPAVQWLVGRAVRDAGLDPELAPYVSGEGLARQAVGAYTSAANGVGYPAILIGAPNGAVAYLAGLLHIPFLPSHFVLSFADRTDPDDTRSYQAHGARLIEPILQNDPNLLAVNHFDPIHDRFLVAEVNHVRLKLLDLPEAYRRFIRAHLAPGGVLLSVDCSFSWMQYQIDDRHFFQVGGLGGYDFDDYLEGSDELDAWLKRLKSKHQGGWQLDDSFELLSQRESEWGTLAELGDAVRRFAAAEGYESRNIHGAHPEDFSLLAHTAYLWEARLHERQPQGLLLECFSQINPTAALRSDLLPLWLPFNCDDSLQFLAGFLPYIPEGLPVVFSLLANFTLTPDLPGAQAWQQIAARIGPVHWIGTNPTRYPIDLASRFDYAPDLLSWTRRHPGLASRPRLSLEELEQMLAILGHDGAALLEDLVKA